MDYKEKMAWLNSLKVGDKVAVKNKAWSQIGVSYSVYTVKYITPARTRFDLIAPNGELKMSVGKDGCTRRADRWSLQRTIEPVTDEILETNRRYALMGKIQLLQSIKDHDWRHISTSDLEALALTVTTIAKKVEEGAKLEKVK